MPRLTLPCLASSGTVDKRMEKLLYSPPDIRLPDNRALLGRVSWLHDAPDDLLQALLAGKLGGAVTEINLVAKQTAVAQVD